MIVSEFIMIPKIIHYCWFGKGEMPKKDKECLDSWRKYMPDYEIKCWNEENFDINAYDYAKAAYKAKKWAYVSDCARFVILYNEGGLFLDTDVLALRSFDDLLNNKCFFGIERPNYHVATGLAIGAEPKNPVIKKILELYITTEFINPDIVSCAPTAPIYATEILKEFGFVKENKLQILDDVTIYPYDFFAPMDYITGLVEKTENTYSIHLYNFSWAKPNDRKWKTRQYKLNNFFGVNVGKKIYLLWSLPERIYLRIKNEGFLDTIKYLKNRNSKT